jgi:hypothetical protein
VPGRAAIVTDWAESSAHRTEARIEAEREGVTMGLYLAIVTLAEASALDSSGVGAGATVAAIWGTAIGLALAHVFAFDLSARIFARGRPHRSTRLSATAQVIAAAAVAALATLPSWCSRGTSRSRSRGSSWPRSSASPASSPPGPEATGTAARWWWRS